MRLFSVPKIPVSLEKVTHESELRRGENRVKIAVLHLKIALTRKHAAAMPDGVLRRLYQQTGEDVDPMVLRVDFSSLCDRQVLTVSAAPDTDETRAIDQVRIYGVHARRGTTENAFTLLMKASFGPLSSDEWAFVDLWRTSQRFVTFKAAQASLEFLPADDEGGDDEEDAGEADQPLPLSEGTCVHGARVGQSCDDCPEHIAVAPPADADGTPEPARQMPRRHPRGSKVAQHRPRTH